jgi:hypothetical protein
VISRLEVIFRGEEGTGAAVAAVRNAASASPLFDAALARHRALHHLYGLDKPLVRADFDHALDTWQWILRLAPEAGLAVQLAALFHDVERLASEAEVRIERFAAGAADAADAADAAKKYQEFKDAHARIGAAWTDEILGALEVDPATRRDAVRLVGRHERPPLPGEPDGDDLALLNDADALSFFSLNSPGYLDYHGPEPTRRKVAWTLERMRPAARRLLAGVRLRADVAEILDSATASAGRSRHP